MPFRFWNTVNMDPNVPAQPIKNEISTVHVQQSVKEIPHSKSKFKLILLIIILLLVVGGGAFYLGVKQNKTSVQKQTNSTIAKTSPTPAPDPTANWKIYANNASKYEIKYPATAKLATFSSDSQFWIYLDKNYTSMSQGESLKQSFSVSITEIYGSAKKDFKDFFKDYINIQIGYEDSTSSPEPAIKNYPAFENNSLITPSGMKILQVFVQSPDKSSYVVLSLLPYDPHGAFENQDGALAIFKQILSTFKFTSQKQIDSAVGWQTYSDLGLGYNFKYPADWSQGKGGDKNDDGTSTIRFSSENKKFGALTIHIMENTNNLTAAAFIRNLAKTNLGYNLVKIIDEYPLYLQNYDAVIADNFYGAGSPGPSALINDRKGNIILFYNDGIGINTLNTILSTFKFTN